MYAEKTETMIRPIYAIPVRRSYQAAKRTLDVVASLCALIVLMPLLLILAALIYIDDPHGSPLYISTRLGKDGRPFRFYKFRTMCVEADRQLRLLRSQNESDGPVFKLRQDPRVTRIGRFLRQYSIDELPQLLNVLLDDMSLVGPRPPLPEEVAMYTPYQMQRLRAKPGMTCYWQVTPGRYQVLFDEWIEMDLRYIRECNFFVDLRIIFKTVGAVLRGK
ncbi:MAG: sugar transferase [Oscillospiraceae bacterium]|jgi:lipopolysaccharide/colanic/teichoic acid biosynthesis glycosyltransferase|nr:sugar transferase [Oscillospiraceae bacterium]